MFVRAGEKKKGKLVIDFSFALIMIVILCDKWMFCVFYIFSIYFHIWLMCKCDGINKYYTPNTPISKKKNKLMTF